MPTTRFTAVKEDETSGGDSQQFAGAVNRPPTSPIEWTQEQQQQDTWLPTCPSRQSKQTQKTCPSNRHLLETEGGQQTSEYIRENDAEERTKDRLKQR